MAAAFQLNQPKRGNNSKRAHSFQPLSKNKKKNKQQQYDDYMVMNNDDNNNKNKRHDPIYLPPISKAKAISFKKSNRSSSKMFGRNKNNKNNKKKLASSQPLHTDKENAFIYKSPSPPSPKGKKKSKFYNSKSSKSKPRYKDRDKRKHHEQQRSKAMTSADLSQKNTLSHVLQQNWNNRKPYQQKRNQLRQLTNSLPQTEFKILLEEHQMTQCYDPVKLYELNKELMVKNIGTCRVEGTFFANLYTKKQSYHPCTIYLNYIIYTALTLMLSLPKGRKDLTEAIQIIEVNLHFVHIFIVKVI